MMWNREPLFTKAKLFFERAFAEDKDEFYFGLWCAMGLELLARSALSSISPALLAESDREHKNLLHVFGYGSVKSPRKSIATTTVLSLCKSIIPNFMEDDFKIAMAIINRRNEEVHTGAIAFEEYQTQHWIDGLYKCCKVLCEFQKESLKTLFEEDVEKEAENILNEVNERVISETKTLITSHNRVFESKNQKDRKKLKDEALKESKKLSYRGYHMVDCPACGCKASIYGEVSGKQKVENNEYEIVVRQSVLPTKFQCSACELKLNGYSSLKSAEIGNHYTRKNTYTPEEYYEMINPDDYDMVTERYIQISEDYGWSNE